MRGWPERIVETIELDHESVVWQDVGQIAVDDVADPKIEEPTDAIVRITMSAICGTDLHLVRGTMQGLVPDTVLGHEAVEVVEKVAESVRGFTPGERVVICSTVACGTCSCCRARYFSPCDTASPNGPAAGTSFFGGPETTGPAELPEIRSRRLAFNRGITLGDAFAVAIPLLAPDGSLIAAISAAVDASEPDRLDDLGEELKKAVATVGPQYGLQPR